MLGVLRTIQLLRTLIAPLAVGVVLASVTPAAADESTDEALRHYHEGRKLYQVAEYSAALVEFKRAFLIREDSVFLFNMAQCQRHLGENEDAITLYKRYLAAEPETENRAVVEKIIHDLQEKGSSDEQITTVPTAPRTPPDESPGGDVPVVEDQPEPESSHLHEQWWFWTGIGVGVTAAVIGVLLLSSGGQDAGCGGVSPCVTL